MQQFEISDEQAGLLLEVLEQNGRTTSKYEALYWDEGSAEKIRELYEEVEDQTN